MSAIRRYRAPALCLFLILNWRASAQTATGSLSVVVKNPSGGRVAAASVQLQREATGYRREPTAALDGEYRFSLVPPSPEYQLNISAPGFASRSVERVPVAVGETTNVEVELSAETATFQVNVAGVAITPVDPMRTQLATIIEPSSIDNLPINRRNYLDFTLLTPGVTDTVVLPEANDFRVKVGPPADLSFSAASGRNGSFTVDGLSISAYSGNVRPSLPQAAVQEFQVTRNGFPAEIGFASGGGVNIVSRSGTNVLHGSAFGYLRHRSIQARNYFDPGKSAYTRVQSGASLGGPVRKDRSFFFAAFERLDRHETVFVPLLNAPGSLSRLTPSQTRLVDFFDASGVPDLKALAPALRFALNPSNNPLIPSLFASNSGTFPFSANVNQGTFRFDHRLADSHLLFARFNISRDDVANTRFGALEGWSSGSSTSAPDHSIVAADTWTLGPRAVLLLRGAFGSTSFIGTPNDLAGPNMIVGGFGTFGRDVFLPNRYRERYVEIHPQLSISRGAHGIKLGADLNWIPTKGDVRTYFGGRFIFGEAIPLGAVLNAVAGNPGFAEALAQALVGVGQPGLAVSLGDPINSLQSLALGLPLAYLQGLGASDYRANRQQHAFYGEDSLRLNRSLSVNLGVRYQAVMPYRFESRHNVAPRIGITWSPFTYDPLVIRAGYGLFYDTVPSTMAFSVQQFRRPDLSLMVVPITGAPVTNPKTGAPVTSIDIWQQLLSTGVLGKRPVQFSDLAAVGIPAGFSFPLTGDIQKDYHLPVAQHAHLAVSRGVGAFQLTASLEASRTQHIFRIVDSNLVQTGRLPDGTPILGRKNPLIANYYLHETSGNSQYWAATFRADRRFRRNLSVNAFYTLSRAIDDVTDYFLDYAPHNPLDKRSERGLSLFHQKHRIVVSGVWESPSTSPLWGGWKAAPIFRANSFRPFNVLSGIDSLGDGQTTNHRPLGLGRNTGIGPNFVTLDFRLTRTFKLTESLRLDATAEVFNLPNRTNFLSVNNVVGPLPLSALPKPVRGVRGVPTQPLGFAAAGDPRQFQFGLRTYF